jgi:hypothetical protein
MAAKKKPKPKRCAGKTKKDKRCKAYAIKGTDRCLAHSDGETQESVGFGGPQEGAGRPRLPRPHEVLRDRIEKDIDRYLAPVEAALGAGKPVVTWSQSDGEHSIEYVSDPQLGLKALKLVFDYAYGRPRQLVELVGEDGGAVKHELEFSDPKVREAMHGLVRAVADARPG